MMLFMHPNYKGLGWRINTRMDLLYIEHHFWHRLWAFCWRHSLFFLPTGYFARKREAAWRSLVRLEYGD